MNVFLYNYQRQIQSLYKLLLLKWLLAPQYVLQNSVKLLHCGLFQGTWRGALRNVLHMRKL